MKGPLTIPVKKANAPAPAAPAPTEVSQNPGALSWDSPISAVTPTPHISPGLGWFKVLKLDKISRPCGKFGVCNVAKLTLEVHNTEDEEATITEDLILHVDMQWRIYQLATSIGQRQHGDSTTDNKPIDWNAVVDAVGYCKITERTYTKRDGTEAKVNNVTFLTKEEADEQQDQIPF